MPVKRLHYFEHQFLHANDFSDEQNYHIEMRRRHNKNLHTWGVTDGLDVVAPHDATEIIVTEGMAIDREGREIVLTDHFHIEESSFPEGTEVYVTVAYKETTTDSSNEAGTGHTRWTEEPLIDTSGSPPGRGGEVILLARVVRSGDSFEIDLSGRRSAGVVSDQTNGTTPPPDQSVTNRMIADNAVDASKIRSGSVGTPQLADGAVTFDKIAPGILTQHGHTAQEISAVPVSGGTISGTLDVVNQTRGIDVFLSTDLQEAPDYAGIYVAAQDQYDSYGIVVKGDNLRNAIDGETTFNGDVTVRGSLAAGSKRGYVVELCINGSGKTIETGDVVKLLGTQIVRYTGQDNKIPVPYITLADQEGDSAVIGVVDCIASPDHDMLDSQAVPEDLAHVPDKCDANVVTLGNYAYCKVDATEDPIQVGDLLTTSPHPGFAKKATVPKIGCVFAKALEPLAGRCGTIAVYVHSV